MKVLWFIKWATSIPVKTKAWFRNLWCCTCGQCRAETRYTDTTNIHNSWQPENFWNTGKHFVLL